MSSQMILILAILAVARLVVWRMWPYTTCKREKCRGGNIHTSNGESFRKCGACNGTGERVRFMSGVLFKIPPPGGPRR